MLKRWMLVPMVALFGALALVGSAALGSSGGTATAPPARVELRSVPVASKAGLFLQYDGVTGAPSATDHSQHIRLESFSWGVSRPISEHQSTGRVQSAEVNVTKATDGSSTKLLRASVESPLANATIYFVNTKGVVYRTIALEQVLISSLSIAAGNDVSTEALSLDFREITDTTNFGTPETFTYDFSGTNT